MAAHVPCNHHMRTFVLFLVVMAVGRSAAGQALSIGVKGGISLVDQTVSKDESRPYLVGPSVEFRLPAGLAIEADALYQRIGNTVSFGYGQGVILASSGYSMLSPILPFISRERGKRSWSSPRQILWPASTFRGMAAVCRDRVCASHSGVSLRYHGRHLTDESGALHTMSYRNDSRSI